MVSNNLSVLQEFDRDKYLHGRCHARKTTLQHIDSHTSWLHVRCLLSGLSNAISWVRHATRSSSSRGSREVCMPVLQPQHCTLRIVHYPFNGMAELTVCAAGPDHVPPACTMLHHMHHLSSLLVSKGLVSFCASALLSRLQLSTCHPA